jgi:tol-pal system protein YbgF
MNSFRRLVGPLTLGVYLGCYAGFANAGLFDDDEARKAILNLQQRLDAVRLEGQQRSTDDNRKTTDEFERMRRSMVELQSQLELTQSANAKLKLQVEQGALEVLELQRKLKSTSQDMDERIRRFEPEKVSVDGRSFVAEPSERRDFDFGVTAFQRGEFTAAQSTLASFMRRYPASGYQPSVLFWLASAQYATKDCKESLANLRLMLSIAPDHARSSDALLGIANCQIELKDAKAGRKTLDDLVKSFPDSEAAITAKDKLLRLR